MKIRWGFIFICLIVCLSAIAGVCAADINETVGANEGQSEEITSIDELSVSPGSFTDLAGEIESAGDELNLTGDYIFTGDDSDYKNGISINKRITINGNGFSINGNNAARALYINFTGVTLNNIVFMNCLINDSDNNHGGAVFVNGAGARLDNCSFINCSISTTFRDADAAPCGGAVYWNGDQGVMDGCSFENCSGVSLADHWSESWSTPYGGAVYWNGTGGTLNDCSFRRCYVSSEHTSLRGGAIFWNGDRGFVNSSQFEDNHAEAGPNQVSGEGGAICWNGAHGNVSNCNFVNNYAESSGGAIMWCGSYGLLSNSSFVNCRCGEGFGGAVYVNEAYGFIFRNCSFVKSHCSGNGGAVLVKADKCSFYGCTFVNNAAPIGGSVAIFNAYCSIHDSIFANSSSSLDEGGAIAFKAGNGLVSNCTFENCSMTCHDSHFVYSGASIYYYGDNCRIYNSSFKNGYAQNGGAIYLQGKYADIRDCIFVNNTGTLNGGAIRFYKSDYISVSNCIFVNNTSNKNSAMVFYSNYGNVTDCIFVNNNAGEETALYLFGDYNRISNCIFVNNTAGNIAGAVYELGAYCEICDCVFLNNTAANNGGAIYWQDDYPQGIGCNVHDCIFIGNTAQWGSAFYYHNTRNVNSTINYNIFINNNGPEITFEVLNNSNTNYNWFGNTADDYTKDPNCPNGKKWLFLNATVDPESMTDLQPVIVFKLYVYDNATKKVSDFDNTLLKPVNLTVSALNGYVNRTWINLGDAIKYIPINTGIGFVSATIENITQTVEFGLDRLNPNISVEAQEVEYGENTRIYLDYLYDATGSVNITLNGTGHNYRLENLDLNRTISLADILPDEYNLTLVYSGDEVFINVTVKSTLKVTKSTVKFIYSNLTTVYGEDNCLEITMADRYGSPVAGAVLTVNLNGVKNYTTDGDGKIRVPTKDLASKTYYVNIAFEGNERYLKSNVTAQITVTRANSTVSVPDIIFDYGSSGNTTISCTGVSYVLGEVINHTEAVVSVDGDVITVSNLDVGSYTLMVSAVGDENHNPANTTAKITVSKISTQITSGPVTATYNVNRDLVITLKDSHGNALSGAAVTVSLNGDKTFTTDKNGQVKINVAKLVPKTYTAKITFNGNKNYKASAANVKVTVKKAKAKITAKKKTFKRKVKTKKYTITLKDNVGKPIKKAKVTIKIKRKTYKATTNAKGKATFKIKKLTKKGTYKSTVTYKGNAYYNKATKKVKIKVK